MNALRTTGRRTAQNLHRHSSRQASSTSTQTTAHHDTPQSEGFGLSFYLLLFSLPAGALLYSFTRGDAETNNPLRALINKYNWSQEEFRERNALHTRMIEQAAHDRALFASAGAPVFNKLRWPEVVSGGSPMNHAAGHSRGNIDEMVEHYREKAFSEEEAKREKIAQTEANTKSN